MSEKGKGGLSSLHLRTGSLCSSAITKTLVCVCVRTCLCVDSLKPECREPQIVLQMSLRDTARDVAHIPINRVKEKHVVLLSLEKDRCENPNPARVLYLLPQLCLICHGSSNYVAGLRR